MASRSPSIALMVVGLASAAVAGFFALQTSTQSARDAAKAAQAVQPKAQWLATAPGRVEPRGGEVKIATAAAGRIVDVAVKVNDVVAAGDVLIRIDAADAQARLAAAEAEAAARRRERDTETVTGPALDRRKAEDAVAVAERNAFASRMELDRLMASRSSASVQDDAIGAARQSLAQTRSKLADEKAALKRAVAAATNMPLLTRLEAGLAAARADLLAAEAAVERARIRAPMDATVLQITARLGEITAPSPENTLAVLGDLTALRVRAEIEERDVTKVRVGQRVSVRSDATGSHEFEGRVAQIAQALGPPRLGPRGPRRPNDVDVLEMVVDLDGSPSLLSGMRVDVYVKPDATVDNGKAATGPKTTH